VTFYGFSKLNVSTIAFHQLIIKQWQREYLLEPAKYTT